MTDTNPVSRWAAMAPYFLALFRIVAAFIFLQSGTMKLFAWPMGMPPDGGTAVLWSQIGIGGILETFGGLLLIVGLFTRPTAFIMSGMMAVAYFQFHQPQGLWPAANGGIPAILYCFLWLYISAAGPGAWAIDNMLGRAPAKTHA